MSKKVEKIKKVCVECGSGFLGFKRNKCCGEKCQTKRTKKLHCVAAYKYREKNIDRYRELARNQAKKFKKRNPERYKEIRRREMDKKHFGGLKYIVMERDNYTCQRCKNSVKGKKKHNIHHVNGNHFYNTLENLITLCISCHQKTHWEMRKGKVTI